jgi:hypothetical protein
LSACRAIVGCCIALASTAFLCLCDAPPRASPVICCCPSRIALCCTRACRGSFKVPTPN